MSFFSAAYVFTKSVILIVVFSAQHTLFTKSVILIVVFGTLFTKSVNKKSHGP